MASGPTTLDPKLAALLAEPVMMIASVRGADGRPAIARIMGTRSRGDGGLDLMFAAGQWPEVTAGLAAGGLLALTVCRPSDYETYQMKGLAEPVAPASDADRQVAAAYIDAVAAELRRLGVAERQIACWLTLEGLARVAFAPADQFAQTPGPGAGRAIEAVR